MEYTYKVEGMTCNGCKASVEKHLMALQNVLSVSVNLEKKEVQIESNLPLSVKQLQTALPKKFSISDLEKETFFSSASDEVLPQDALKQLKPLFIIFAYLIGASILLHYKNWSWSAFMFDFMGLFYIVFSFFKLLDLKGFSKSFAMYDPLAKRSLSYGYIYPFIEVILGVLFLLRVQIPLALIITLVVLGITTFGVSKTLLNKQTIQCACLGTALKLPMTKATFIENAIMITMAIVMLIKTYS